MAKDKFLPPTRVEEEVKEAFFQACKDNDTTPSAEIYKFVKQYIKRKQGSKILLSDLHNKR